MARSRPNGLSRESGLLKQWPASGPPLVWSVSNLGAGYGSIAVSGDRIFVQGLKGRDSTVSSLNRADGKPVWSKILGPSGNNDRGPGPRGTPTVDGDRVYVLTESGDLACLRVQDGSVLWQRNILKDFGGTKYSVADQRIAAGRRKQRDRDAGRPQRRHGCPRQDDGEDDLDEQRAER